MKKKDPIEEARRYVENAHDTLVEKGEYNSKTKRYEDPKYVRAAGHYLWHAVLTALDSVFEVRADKRTRVHINDYLNVISKRDQKLLDWVDDGYTILHLHMGYDGVQIKKVCDEGFHLANNIINRCAVLRPKAC